MTNTALRDAFVAGYHTCENHELSDQDILRKFDHWYQSALTTLDRSPSEWIDWDGSSDMPPGVEPDTLVEVKFRSGVVSRMFRAVIWYWKWDNDEANGNIVAYKVVRT